MSDEITMDAAQEEVAEQVEAPEAEESEAPDAAELQSKLERAQRTAARRDRLVRELQAKVKAHEDAKAEKPEGEPADPVAVANERLVRAEARTALVAAGVTDREDQKAVLGLLSLAGIDVSPDGDVDGDEIADRIEVLRKAFGGGQGAPRRGPRVDTRDRSAGSPTVDPDASRYQRFMSGRR